MPEGKYLTVSTDFWDYACGLRTDQTITCWGTTSNRDWGMPPFESPWKDNAKLLGLALSSGNLSPKFDKNATSYTATVANSVTSVTVSPELTNLIATYTVASDNDADVSDDQVDLIVGANTVNITVTSADKTTTRTYTVVVTREAS